MKTKAKKLIFFLFAVNAISHSGIIILVSKDNCFFAISKLFENKKSKRKEKEAFLLHSFNRFFAYKKARIAIIGIMKTEIVKWAY